MLEPYTVTKDLLMADRLITLVAGFFLTSMVVAAITSLDDPKHAVEVVPVRALNDRDQPRV